MNIIITKYLLPDVQLPLNNNQTEKLFFEKNGLQHFETILGMLMDLRTFNISNRANENEQFQEVMIQTAVNWCC